MFHNFVLSLTTKTASMADDTTFQLVLLLIYIIFYLDDEGCCIIGCPDNAAHQTTALAD